MAGGSKIETIRKWRSGGGGGSSASKRSPRRSASQILGSSKGSYSKSAGF